MKLELTRFINEIQVKSAQYTKLTDAYDGMKLWVSMEPGLFDTKTRYDKHFVLKNLEEDHVIFPHEHQSESNDYFLLKQLEAPPARAPPRTAATALPGSKRLRHQVEEVADSEGDLQPMQWGFQPPDFVGPFACIISMSQSAFKKYTDNRVKAMGEYNAFAKEVSEKKGAGDLNRFVQITAQINGLEKAYSLSVRHFLMYMCQSGLPPVDALYDLNQICMHTPANKLNVQLRVFDIAMTETFKLPDFNYRDFTTLCILLQRSFDVQEEIDGTNYNNETLLESFSKIDPSWFLDPLVLDHVHILMDFCGADVLWAAIPTDQDFDVPILGFLEKLKEWKNTGHNEFLQQLDEKGFSHKQIQYYAFSGEESPNDEASYNILSQFFTVKGDVEETRRVKALKMARFPELSAFLSDIPLVAEV